MEKTGMLKLLVARGSAPTTVFAAPKPKPPASPVLGVRLSFSRLQRL